MAAYTIVLEGTEDAATITPYFEFGGGDTVEVEIDDVSQGFLTSGVAGSFTLNSGEKLEYICSDWDDVTVIDIQSDKVSGDISGWTLPASLVTFSVRSTSVSGDISGWTLPASLVTFAVYTTSVEGDISGWTLPASLVNFYVSSTSVEGDISGWSLPASLEYFYVDITSVSGDISGWSLPASLVTFAVNNTSVSGDISDWTLPAPLVNFYVSTTSVEGDISGWTLPASLVNFYVSSTSVSYLQPGGAFSDVTNALTKIDADNCGWDVWQVDRALKDLVDSGADSNTIDIAGTNSGPSQLGSKYKTALEGDSWTVNANATVVHSNKLPTLPCGMNF